VIVDSDSADLNASPDDSTRHRQIVLWPRFRDRNHGMRIWYTVYQTKFQIFATIQIRFLANMLT
jgi:hypothetical protein